MTTRHRPAGALTAAGALVAIVLALVGTLSTASASTTTATADRTAARTAATPPATRIRVVRPVTAAGRPAAGWTVHKESGSADCWGASTAAVDDGITTCGPSAAYLPSCWKSRRHTVLCVRDVATRKLVRVHYSGAYPTATAPARPTPQRLVLRTGSACQVRVGGAWGPAPGHPYWVGFYSCESGSVYGPMKSGGVNMSHPLWWVHLLKNDGDIVTRGVRRAVFVGTAA